MRRLVSISVVCILVFAVCTSNTLATTLAESFRSGTSFTPGTATAGGQNYTKYCYAQTVGYKKSHYVRAYIGGSSSSATNAIADTGRKFSNGDIKATCSTKALVPFDKVYRSCFPTGYAKYGTS